MKSEARVELEWLLEEIRSELNVERITMQIDATRRYVWNGEELWIEQDTEAASA